MPKSTITLRVEHDGTFDQDVADNSDTVEIKVGGVAWDAEVVFGCNQLTD